MKPTQRQLAYQHIREKITTGVLPAGERLSATVLARELGVSHIPVREAISQLQSEGLVVCIAHRGAFVKGADRTQLVDLIELRTLLECNAAAQAARRISATQLIELDDRWSDLCQCLDLFRSPSEADSHRLLQKWLLADLAFHLAILRAAGNREVLRVMQNVRAMTFMFGYRTGESARSDLVTFMEENLRVHREIYEAVRRRDPKGARRTMSVHMHQAGKNLLARFDRLERAEIDVDSDGLSLFSQVLESSGDEPACK